MTKEKDPGGATEEVLAGSSADPLSRLSSLIGVISWLGSTPRDEAESSSAKVIDIQTRKVIK